MISSAFFRFSGENENGIWEERGAGAQRERTRARTNRGIHAGVVVRGVAVLAGKGGVNKRRGRARTAD